jgi:hypothetical protein
VLPAGAARNLCDNCSAFVAPIPDISGSDAAARLNIMSVVAADRFSDDVSDKRFSLAAIWFGVASPPAARPALARSRTAMSLFRRMTRRAIASSVQRRAAA